MNTEIESIVVLHKDEYDELVEKSKLSKERIKEEAKKLYAEDNEVPALIDFYVYGNVKNFAHRFGFKRKTYKQDIINELNNIEPVIMEWIEENVKMYDKAMRERHNTEKECIGLRRHVDNLKAKINNITMRYTWCLCYSITVTALFILLVTFIFKNN